MGQMLFFISIGLWVLLDLYVMLFHSRKQSKIRIEKKSKYIIIITILMGMLIPPFLIPGTKAAFLIPFSPIRYVSIVFVLAGIFIRVLSIWQLKNDFSDHVVIQDGKKLHQHGMYAYIRHPSYLGEIIIFIGVAIAFNQWVASIFAVVIPTIGFLYRMHIEEKVMLDHFQGAYKDYQQTTKKIIPFIY